MEPQLNQQAAPNSHVHPLFRDLLNSFANTVTDAARLAELDEEKRAEWRAEDRERERMEREEGGAS